MALNTDGYKAFNVFYDRNDVLNPLGFEVRIDPATNNGADILAFYSGTLIHHGVKGTGSSWRRGVIEVVFPTQGRKWTTIPRGPGWATFRKGTVVVSLASIANKNHAVNAGWAVDGADLDPVIIQPQVGGDDRLYIRALLAVRDSDGVIWRLSYQVTALGTEQR